MTTQIEVRERPILFSGHMVRAILDGRKTQTRRVIKPQPDYLWHDDPCSNDKGYISCPYGKPGDRLWVRESFWLQTDLGLPSTEPQPIAYTADGNTQCLEDYKQKPSIFMPRWASRITLEVTGVRVERLQDISEADAIAEGIEPLFSQEAIRTTVGLEPYRFGQPVPWTNYLWHGRKGGSEGYSSADNAVDSYRSLWDSINGKKHPWSSNPWVFVVEFRRVAQ